MRRANDEILKHRTILKAAKLSSQKGMPLATEDVLRRRKIVKVKRSSFGSPLGHEARHNSPPSTAVPVPERNSSQGDNASGDREEAVVENAMRAKLFSKDGTSGWVNTAAGTLRCCRAASKQIIQLRNGGSSVLFEKVVGELKGLETITKQTAKGKASYVKFSATIDPKKGEEPLLIQVKPELLDELYAFCSVSGGAPRR